MEVVKGYKLPFKSTPIQLSEPSIPIFSNSETFLVNESVKKLLETAAIVESVEESGQFVSKIFTVSKPDGSRRPIINLKKLNEFIDSPHFKMESIKVACTLVNRNSFMAVIDLKEAYHAIPIDNDHQKFLKFRWNGKLYKYTCLPFGLSVAPFLNTKITKPVLAFLRSKGFLLVGYLDDTLVIGNTLTQCADRVNEIIAIFDSLGFVVNFEKSQLVPAQEIRFLGFILNSVEMKLRLQLDKVDKILQKCKIVQKIRNVQIQTVAELIGMLIAATPATKYGLLYTRQLESEKTEALFQNSGNYKKIMHISEKSVSDLSWWISKLGSEWQYLRPRTPLLTITSDASPSGWGAECNSNEARGNWSEDHLGLHINVLELWAVFYGLNTFATRKDMHIMLRVDSSTAMGYINKLGGCKSFQCHDVAKLIWKWCEEREIIITATYINTKDNFVADRLSRAKVDVSDFMLSIILF